MSLKTDIESCKIVNQQHGVVPIVSSEIVVPRPGCIKTVELWEASCDKCAWTQLAPNYDEASIHLTCHLDTAHKGWDNEARHNEKS